mgnify:CR=1 FL=1
MHGLLSPTQVVTEGSDVSHILFIGEGGEIRLSQVVENKPSRVLALLPADTATGTYTVEVRTKNTGNKTDGKALKRGSFDRTVTVA